MYTVKDKWLGCVAAILEHNFKIFPAPAKEAWSICRCNGTPLQCSCLEDPMARGAWWAAVHGVTKSQTRLSDFTFTFHFHALEKAMATHSSVLAWRIPGTGKPGGLPSMGSHRVGHDWSDLAAAAAAAMGSDAMILVFLIFSLKPTLSHYEKCWAGWVTSWNQDTSDMQMIPL